MPVAARMPRLDDVAGPKLVFYRASNEGIRSPQDVVLLLEREGIEPGIIRARNPATHDQWWVPLVDIAETGTPYALALGAVIRGWLKRRNGRQVRFELGSLKISANTVAEVESMLSTLAKHHRKLSSIHVTKAQPKSKKILKKKPVK